MHPSARSSTASPATPRWPGTAPSEAGTCPSPAPVTFKNAEPLREALRAVPLSQVLVETDAPYLTPMPYRGRRNAGYLVPHTVRAMAEVTGRALEDVCETLWSTAERLYGPL